MRLLFFPMGRTVELEEITRLGQARPVSVYTLAAHLVNGFLRSSQGKRILFACIPNTSAIIAVVCGLPLGWTPRDKGPACIEV